eukprot:4856189-Amphidinium_carterae.1
MFCVSAHSVAQGQHCLSAHCAVEERVLMPSATMRKIQKITNDEVKDRQALSKGSPLGCLAHVPAPEGHTSSKRKRTSLS